MSNRDTNASVGKDDSTGCFGVSGLPASEADKDCWPLFAVLKFNE